MNVASRVTRERNDSTRYELLVKIAAGGMGSVFVGRTRGALGFASLVAIKRPHAHLLEQDQFRIALIEEAKLASKIRHANVVSVRDVTVERSLVYLVMDYVEGGSLAELLGTDAMAETPLPLSIATRIALDACAGLHAAHEARGDDGRPLELVHRDVSPHNILVGVDGVSRITDFGIAKPLGAKRMAVTETGAIKGKLSYMAPEYLRGEPIDRRADVFALGVVLWELFAGRRLFAGEHDGVIVTKVLIEDAPAVRDVRPDVPAAFEEVIRKALAREREARFPTVEALGDALEGAARAADVFASHRDVAALAKTVFGRTLEQRVTAIRLAMDDEGENTIDLVPDTARMNQTSGASAVVLPPTVRAPIERMQPRPRAAPAEVGESTLASADVLRATMPLDTLAPAKIAPVAAAQAPAPIAVAAPATPRRGGRAFLVVAMLGMMSGVAATAAWWWHRSHGAVSAPLQAIAETATASVASAPAPAVSSGEVVATATATSSASASARRATSTGAVPSKQRPKADARATVDVPTTSAAPTQTLHAPDNPYE